MKQHLSRPARADLAAACLSLLATVVLLASGAGSAAASPACSNEALRVEQHATFLPDCRAYEMVSPPTKNGGYVIPTTARTVAASDGEAVTFASLTPFGDVKGTGVATEYLAERGVSSQFSPAGWNTHAISAPATVPLPVSASGSSFEPMFLDFTADLSRGVWQSWAPQTADPYVQEVPNLYLRGGLRHGAAASYDLITACPLCESSTTPLPPFEVVPYVRTQYPRLAGISGDASHALFESRLKLTDDAVDGRFSGAQNVYEYDHGIVRLASVMPSGLAADDADVGQGLDNTNAERNYTPHVISVDGNRAFFTTNFVKCTLSKGPRACGDIYLRDSSAAPPQSYFLNSSERSAPDPAGHRPAAYWDASSDGSRAFFNSDEELTDAPGAGLYMFDLTAPEGSRLTLIGPDASALLGLGEDGHLVYFTAPSQLVSGEPPVAAGSQGIFLWDDTANSPVDRLRFVGALDKGALWVDAVAGLGNAQFRPRQSRVSPDGRFLLFSALNGAGLLSLYGGEDYDHGSCEPVSSVHGCEELYLYDAQVDSLRCASCRPDGATAGFSASVNAVRFQGVSSTPLRQNHPLTPDGRYVFFSTAESLIEEDTNGTSDAYRYDSKTEEVHLLSSGTHEDPSFFMDATADGKDAFITTAKPLVGWDIDNVHDLYDVRVEGGFPEPPPVSASCNGDATCRPPLTPEPFAAALGSNGLIAPGNTHSTRCPRGRRPVRIRGAVRCTKRKKHAGETRRHRKAVDRRFGK